VKSGKQMAHYFIRHPSLFLLHMEDPIHHVRGVSQ
jgi:hypothetical protein